MRSGWSVHEGANVTTGGPEWYMRREKRAEKAIPAALESTGQRVWTVRREISTDRQKRLRDRQKAVNQGGNERFTGG